MAVECSKCGEELLGAVNCCWRCGQPFEARTGPSDTPPVRRTPPVQTARVVVEEKTAEEDSSEPAEEEAETKAMPLRRGSPFGDRGVSEVITADLEEVPSPVGLPPLRRDGGARVAAILTFPIGGIGLLLAFSFPTGGLVVAAFGIAIGTWGLYSQHRGVALTGLLLCCLCLAIAGFNTAVELYVHFYGVAPWESNDPIVP